MCEIVIKEEIFMCLICFKGNLRKAQFASVPNMRNWPKSCVSAGNSKTERLYGCKVQSYFFYK